MLSKKKSEKKIGDREVMVDTWISVSLCASLIEKLPTHMQIYTQHTEDNMPLKICCVYTLH